MAAAGFGKEALLRILPTLDQSKSLIGFGPFDTINRISQERFLRGTKPRKFFFSGCKLRKNHFLGKNTPFLRRKSFFGCKMRKNIFFLVQSPKNIFSVIQDPKENFFLGMLPEQKFFPGTKPLMSFSWTLFAFHYESIF